MNQNEVLLACLLTLACVRGCSTVRPQLILSHHPVLHAVVDLSCYDSEAAYDLGTYLITYRVSWYIYLSSDSVYEVCQPARCES